MKNFTNQRGLAALEVVIVAAIVAIFATAAVPKMARILDKVQLDYEMKHLYSTFNLARSIGKNSIYKASGFGGGAQDDELKFIVNKNNNKYHILRGTTSNPYAKYYEHFLPEKFDLKYDGNILQITFNNPSMYSEGSKTITLTSRFGYKAKIVANSVGRWRGTYE